MNKAIALWLLMGSATLLAEEKTPKFREQTIDDKIEIGYAVTVADVDGDGKPDILVVDKKQIVWYHNPDWTKHVIAENLTEHDNVCIAARDIDGSGKCSIAVGAEWNPADTVNSGAVFYLIPPADRTQKWEPVKFPSVEPTTHRMKWVRRGNKEDGSPRYDLVVVPLHGRGNKNGEGAAVKVLAYQMPKNPHDEWKSEVVIDKLMHMTHNFDIQKPSRNSDQESLALGGKEGLMWLENMGKWEPIWIKNHQESQELKGVGEARYGSRPQSPRHYGEMVCTVEPMHGNILAIYEKMNDDLNPSSWKRTELDTTLVEGHALACGDLLGLGRDQIVVGWRGKTNDRLGKVGIKMFVSDENGEHWEQHLIDDNAMACEDLVLADLNGDGKLDIIASGRRTKNVKIYWNETK
jgi:hypothetical protein